MARPRPSTGLRRLLLPGAAAAVLAAGAALASETIRYDYDARGRLVKAVRTAQPSGNTVTTEYSYDKADNRTRRETRTGQ